MKFMKNTLRKLRNFHREIFAKFTHLTSLTLAHDSSFLIRVDPGGVLCVWTLVCRYL